LGTVEFGKGEDGLGTRAADAELGDLRKERDEERITQSAKTGHEALLGDRVARGDGAADGGDGVAGLADGFAGGWFAGGDGREVLECAAGRSAAGRSGQRGGAEQG